MTVKAIAKRSGVSPNVIRYYTRIGLLKPMRNPRNGYKQYAATEMARLRFIRQAKSLGLTLAEIAHIIRESERGRAASHLTRRIVERRIEENRQALSELTALQRRMEQALAKWSTVLPPAGRIVDGHGDFVLPLFARCRRAIRGRRRSNIALA